MSTDMLRIPLANDKSNYHYYYQWEVEKPLAWVHIMHGMSEHSARYLDLAKFLNNQGITVTADDHRGHGVTGSKANSLYHLADNDGWNKLLDDQWQLIGHIAQTQSVPLILLGHSMGSYMALEFCQQYGKEFNRRFPIPLSGLALSGCGYNPPIMAKIARSLAFIERLRLGAKKTSPILEQLCFGQFNRQFKPVRTAKDWICSDPRVVDAYIQDPYCGGAISTQSWFDFVAGLGELFTISSLQKLDKNLPIYLFSGDLDPVGKRGKGVTKLQQILLQLGVLEVQMRLYHGRRHEMLNEVNRDQVFNDLLIWLQQL